MLRKMTMIWMISAGSTRKLCSSWRTGKLLATPVQVFWVIIQVLAQVSMLSFGLNRNVCTHKCLLKFSGNLEVLIVKKKAYARLTNG